MGSLLGKDTVETPKLHLRISVHPVPMERGAWGWNGKWGDLELDPVFWGRLERKRLMAGSTAGSE